MKIAVGGIVQEGNSFSPLIGTLEDFRRHYYLEGDAMLRPPDINNELRGFLQALQEPGITIVPLFFATAVSSGKLAASAFAAFRSRLEEHLGTAPALDGVLFALHGAQVAEDCDDPEGELLAAIRARVGPDVPIVATLDSHANVTRRMVAGVQALIGYRTFPHVDFADTGYRAGKLLLSILKGEIRPCMEFRKVPMIVPAENQQTTRGPMRELWREAEAGEHSGDALITSLFAVQPWLDVDEMGFTVVVICEDRGRAAREAERLAKLAWAGRCAFEVELYMVDAVIALLEQRKTPGPMIVSDSADSPGAGSPGDSNFVLRQLLKHRMQERWRCLLTMVDAQAVDTAVRTGTGRRVRLTAGHSISLQHGSPVEIEGRVESIGNGEFVFGGGFSAGLSGHMGRCAVLRIGTISLVLHEWPVFTGDPAMYRSVGLEPAEADLVLVKSAAQFREEYEKISEAIYILDTPGASTPNLRSLPFRKVPRPIFPLDPEVAECGQELGS